jgi:hypothetical protein
LDLQLIDGKKREKLFLELLDEKHGPFPESEHADSPDFLIAYPDHVLGIECTEIYSENEVNGIPLKQHESIKNRIVEKAKLIAIEQELPPIHVSIFFDGTIGKHREKNITSELLQTVKDNCPPEGQKVELGGIESSHLLSNELRRLLISNIPGPQIHHWHVVDSGWVQTNFSEQVQAKIDSKSEKLNNYLNQCDKCWLIIAAVGYGPSSFYEPSEEMLKHIYNSPFERVFFMEAFSKYIVELNVNNSARYLG